MTTQRLYQLCGPADELGHVINTTSTDLWLPFHGMTSQQVWWWTDKENRAHALNTQRTHTKKPQQQHNVKMIQVFFFFSIIHYSSFLISWFNILKGYLKKRWIPTFAIPQPLEAAALKATPQLTVHEKRCPTLKQWLNFQLNARTCW